MAKKKQISLDLGNLDEKLSSDNYMNICYKDFRGVSSFNAKVDEKYIETDDYIKMLNDSKTNYFFEWTSYETLVKPFYDIDADFTSESLFNDVVDDIQEEVITKLSVKFPLGNFGISQSHGWKNKEYTQNKIKKHKKVYALSFHIVVNNYQCSIKELRQFNEENNIYSWLPHCDKSVYRNGGNMRALYSNKPNDNRTKKPINWVKCIKNHIIQSNEKTNEQFNKIELKKKEVVEQIPITSFKPISPPVSSPSEEDDKEVEKIVNEQIKENNKMTLFEFEKLKLAVLKLDKKRAIGYSGNGDWLDVGMALYNNGDNMNNKTLKLWEEFSKQCNEKYDEMVCMNKWMTFTPRENGLTIASIYHWLKQDNPEEHNKIEIKDTLEDKERFKNAYFANMKYNEEKKEYEGKPNIDGLVTLMNKEIMRTKKNEYIQVDDKNNHYLMVKADAIDDYAMYIFYDGKKKINPFKLWYENINRKNVIGLKFDPSMKEDPKYYNICKGMNYKKTDDLDYSKIDGFLIQIKDGWANGDDKTNEYLLNWFAHIIQKPNEKTQVAIVIPSETEGNGKNIILNQIQKILGSLYLSTSSVDDIIGTFNPLAEGRILINLNECTWAGRKQQSGMLKALVTEDTMRINNKNVKPYMIDNYSNVVVTSNEENPIEIGKVARRYYVIEIRERILTSKEVKSILDTDTQVLFNYLMNRDISNFDPKDFEDTEKTQQIKEFSFGTEFIYWKHCLDNNHIEHYDYSICWDDLKDSKFKILKSHIIKSYQNLEYGYNQKMTDNQFWKISKQIFPNMKLINADKNYKPRCELYDLDEMKKDFNKFFGNEYY
tara:strand:+ start:17 stop:2494 length:2478 start_codon:yes stop_codon:yes gene_type:complete